MRKLFLFSLIFFSFFILGSSVHAQNSAAVTQVAVSPIIRTLPSNPIPPFFGEDQKYTVTLRGNGEAVVTTRITFANTNDATRSALTVRIPRGVAQDALAFQVLQEPYCVQYKQPSIVDKTKTLLQPVCMTYQEPDYYTYWAGQAKYQKAPIETHGDTLDISLPKPLTTNTSGSIILYYRASGYAKKNLFGAYDFTFETLKVEEPIQNVTIGINTDSEMIIKGTKGNVNYRVADAGILMKETASMAPTTMNQQMNQVIGSIGYGMITKSASNLQPLDSYTVKGTYADSNVRLYGAEILISVIVFLAIVVLLSFTIRFLWKKFQPKNDEKKTKTIHSGPLLITLGLSVASTFVALLYSLVLLIVLRSLVTNLPYDLRSIITILLCVISLGIYALVIFAPGLFVGLRHGVSWGLGTVGLTIVWLISVAMVLFLLTLVFSYSLYGIPAALPMMNRVQGSTPSMMEGSSEWKIVPPTANNQ